MDPAGVQVEPEGLGLSLAQCEGRGALGRVGEPQQLGQAGRSVGGLDVAQYPAGADRSELLVISDEPDAAAATHDELHGSVQGQGVGHASLVDHHETRRADLLRPHGQVAMFQ